MASPWRCTAMGGRVSLSAKRVSLPRRPNKPLLLTNAGVFGSGRFAAAFY